MMEQNQNLDADGKPIESAAVVVPATALEEKVELTPTQYNAMLDAIDELNELKSASARASVTPTVDSLAEEGRGRVTPEGTTAEDLEEMRPRELINLILQEVDAKVSQPLMVKIEEIRVKDEIRELLKEEENKDFWDYKEEVYTIASRNPNLSIEEAYKLAKSNKGSSKKSDGGEKENTLKTLPGRRSVPVGEKPGPSGSSITASEPETRKEAAQMAWDKMQREGKV